MTAIEASRALVWPMSPVDDPCPHADQRPSQSTAAARVSGGAATTIASALGVPIVAAVLKSESLAAWGAFIDAQD